MSILTAPSPSRDQVENLVRSILRKHLGDGAASAGNGKPDGGYRPNLVVNISARHCHLTQADVEVLFGRAPG